MWQFSIFIGNRRKHKTTDIWRCANEDQCVPDKTGCSCWTITRSVRLARQGCWCCACRSSSLVLHESYCRITSMWLRTRCHRRSPPPTTTTGLTRPGQHNIRISWREIHILILSVPLTACMDCWLYFSNGFHHCVSRKMKYNSFLFVCAEIALEDEILASERQVPV